MAGFQLQLAQQGLKHDSVEPFDRRLGAKVLKIAIDFKGDTYRVLYTPALTGTVCVLDAFKKKSNKGKATPQHDFDRVADRFKWAKEAYGRGDLPSQQS